MYDAFRLYTVNGTKAAFEEKTEVTLEPGKFADLIMLNQNPLSAPAESLIDTKVEMTLVGRKIVYQQGSERRHIEAITSANV